MYLLIRLLIYISKLAEKRAMMRAFSQKLTKVLHYQNLNQNHVSSITFQFWISYYKVHFVYRMFGNLSG